MDKKNKYKESEMFRVPGNYFEELTEKMVGMTEKEQDTRKPGFFAIARPHLMLAASMIFLVIISYATLRFLLPGIQNTNPEYDGDSITEYLASEIDEMILLEDIDLEGVFSGNALPLESGLYEDEIIDYLIDGNINYEDIIENL